MKEPLVEFAGVSKQYQIGLSHRSLRGALGSIPKRLFSRKKQPTNLIWALKDASFTMDRGESLGLIGHNGAGKTTILKLLSGITKPTQGEIHIHGRLGSLIELGAGFHPEMTGRENVYLNGVILGMSRKEIRQRFDSIVEFSGIEQFIDTPVKRYSSGMYVRLAFAVAAHIEPAVLLVDEVLAVGDFNFRAKCYRHIAKLRQNGTSIILVSHDVQAIRDVCERAILVWRGKLIDDGNPEDIIPRYLKRMRSSTDADNGEKNQVFETGISVGLPASRGSAGATIEHVSVIDLAGQAIEVIESGGGVAIELTFSLKRELEKPIIRIDFYKSGDLATGFSTGNLNYRPEFTIGLNYLRLDIPHLTLPSGSYSISVAIVDTLAYNIIDLHHQRYHFEITMATGGRGDISIPHSWVQKEQISKS